MNDEKEIKERILHKASEMFFHYGFQKVTMDEIAVKLGMSKKTLYKFYPGKEHLLREMFQNVKCEIDDYIAQLWSDENMDFVVKLKKMMNFIGSHSSKLRGPLMEDVQKYLPEIWNEIQEFRRDSTQKKLSTLITEGVRTGVFRNDIEQSIIVLTYISAIQTLITPEMLSQLPVSANQVFETLGKVIFEGILTDEGRQKYCSISINNNGKYIETSGENNENRQ